MSTVTIGANDYDSFATVAFADTYLAADIARSTGWFTKNNDTKGRGLVSATRMLLGLTWCEDPPPLPTDAEIDPVIQQVTAMLAADLVAKPRLQGGASGNSNVKVAKAGSAQVEFFSPVDGNTPLPPELWGMLQRAGLVCGSDPGDGTNAGAFVSGVSGCRPLGGRYPWDWPIAEEDYG